MGRQIIFARRTGGSRCCRFGGKSNNTTIKSHATRPNNQQTRSIREQHESPAIDHIRNPNIPSNAQVQANKPKMDKLTEKLSSVKVKAKNISFSL